MFALALGLAGGCRKTPAVDCTPPPAVLVCPDGGSGPDFATVVYPQVFAAVCANCHAPGQTESSMPLTSYAQIYGKNGSEAQEIFNQVFESCLMPPSNATAPLTDGGRQTLLDWFACGAKDSPAPDGGAGD